MPSNAFQREIESIPDHRIHSSRTVYGVLSFDSLAGEERAFGNHPPLERSEGNALLRQLCKEWLDGLASRISMGNAVTREMEHAEFRFMD